MSRRVPGNIVRDAVAGGITLILAGAYWLGADAIRASPLAGNGVGASAVPKGLAFALACFSAVLILQSAWKWRRAVAEAPPSQGRSTALRPHLRAAGMLLIGIAFLAVLNILGYWPSLVVLFTVTAFYSGQSLSKRLVLFSLIVATVYYLLFVELLGIPFPSGIWASLWVAVAGRFT